MEEGAYREVAQHVCDHVHAVVADDEEADGDDLWVRGELGAETVNKVCTSATL